jgi:predicted regulator of Ras-like GTPase activity (Roadblock/LC7/MglB family)
MDKEKLRFKKEKVLACMTPEQIKAIQKDNPFRSERNEVIRDLRRRGVEHAVIAEISGLAVTQEKNIAGKMPPYAALSTAIEGIRADIEAYFNDIFRRYRITSKKGRR